MRAQIFAGTAILKSTETSAVLLHVGHGYLLAYKSATIAGAQEKIVLFLYFQRN